MGKEVWAQIGAVNNITETIETMRADCMVILAPKDASLLLAFATAAPTFSYGNHAISLAGRARKIEIAEGTESAVASKAAFVRGKKMKVARSDDFVAVIIRIGFNTFARSADPTREEHG